MRYPKRPLHIPSCRDESLRISVAEIAGCMLRAVRRDEDGEYAVGSEWN